MLKKDINFQEMRETEKKPKLDNTIGIQGREKVWKKFKIC